jgi:hypothetical protein
MLEQQSLDFVAALSPAFCLGLTKQYRLDASLEAEPHIVQNESGYRDHLFV